MTQENKSTSRYLKLSDVIEKKPYRSFLDKLKSCSDSFGNFTHKLHSNLVQLALVKNLKLTRCVIYISTSRVPMAAVL